MRTCLILICLLIFSGDNLFAQTPQNWPKSIVSGGTTIKIYQPQVETYSADTVRTRGAFSILSPGQTDPVFGAIWVNATLRTDRAQRTAVLQKIKVEGIRFCRRFQYRRSVEIKSPARKRNSEMGYATLPGSAGIFHRRRRKQQQRFCHRPVHRTTQKLFMPVNHLLWF